MATSLSYTFNLNIPTTNLTVGEKIVFKLYNSSPPSSANFTASLNADASLVVSSLAASTGYSTVTTGSANINAGGFFDSASIADTGSNDIVFSQALSGFWDNNYIFVPNPITSSNATPYTNTLYSSSIANYGDVDYPFSPVIPCYDIVLIYLNDGTYIEARVTNTYKDNNGLLHYKNNEPILINFSEFNDIAESLSKTYLYLIQSYLTTNSISKEIGGIIFDYLDREYIN